MSRKIEVQILGDSKSLEAALGRSQQKTSAFGKTLAAGAKVATGALLGIGAAAVVGFKELQDQLKVAAQTEAVLKSTGGAANVTAKHVDALSQSIMNYSGQDDEAVKSSENILLTFTQIRNAAGKTGGIFDQATKVTADLAQAMGLDLNQAALQVGKALNDPAKGFTRLQRIGVQFSAAQEKMIKHFVKTGQTAKAQKVILGELNKEFGGSAKAFGQTLPGQIKILQETFKNLAASLISVLLPSFRQFVGILNSAVKWMKENQSETRIIIGVIAGLSAAVIAVNAVYKVWSATTKVVAAAQWLLNAALNANPISLIIIGVIALGVALVVAYKKSQTFRNIVNAAFGAVKSAASAVWDFLKGPLTTVWNVLKSVATSVLGTLKDHIGTVKSVLGTLRNVAGNVFDFVGDKIQTVVNVAKSLWGWVNDVISAIQSLIGWIGKIHIPDISLPSIPGIGSVAGLAGGGGGNTENRPLHVHVYLDGKEIHSSVQREDKVFRRQNGRSAFA